MRNKTLRYWVYSDSEELDRNLLTFQGTYFLAVCIIHDNSWWPDLNHC